MAAMGEGGRMGLVGAGGREGPEGVATGEGAEGVGVSAATVSHNLREVSRAGVVSSRRDGRSILYSAAYPVLADLIAFLMRDCCQGRAEICTPAAETLAACLRRAGDTAHA